MSLQGTEKECFCYKPIIPCESGTRLIKLAVSAAIFILILTSSVLSKLTLAGLTDALKYYTWIYRNDSNISELQKEEWNEEHHHEIVALYWQLLLSMLVPNCLTFLRCFLFGFFGESDPWPTIGAVFWVSFVNNAIAS